MTPEQVGAAYRRHLGNFEEVSIRRYTGAGAARPRFDWPVQARVLGAEGKDLAGPIVQHEVNLIMLHQDLIDAQAPLPLGTGPNWKVMVRGREMQIASVDDNTRRLQGVLIAYDIKVTG